MKIKMFECKNLHGYISKRVHFNDGLTILTGINGTGKTSIIQAIISLARFDLKNLTFWEYERIAVDFTHEHTDYHLEAIAQKDVITFTVNDKTISVPRFAKATEYIPELDSHIERVELEIKSNSPVKEVIEFPNPLMLGIDRKFDGSNDRVNRAPIGRKNSLFKKSGQYDNTQEAIQNAVLIAESRYRGVKFSLSRQAEILKTQIVSSSIKFMPKISLGRKLNTDRNWVELRAKIDLAIETFKNIGVSESDAFTLNDVYDRYHKNSTILNGKTELDDIHKDPETFEAYMQLQFLMPAIEHIEALLSMIEENKNLQQRMEKPIHQFKTILNRFLLESGKCVEFSPNGELVIQATKRDGANIKINGLSSGEAQLLAIFCILGFPERRTKSDTVLIDEPEISLHILWQENFIPAMLEISPSSQLIVATHSPSIIGERTAACIDVGDCDA